MIFSVVNMKLLLLACVTVMVILAGGCAPSVPGLENKPPPAGGPKVNNRRPPGEMNKPIPNNH